MRKFLFLLLLILPVYLSAQQDNAPVLGVSDKRTEIYGLKNARVVVDYLTTLENTDILIADGRIKATGKGLVFPEGTIVYDLTGKTVYPSFIDIYAGNYGIKAQTPSADASPYAGLIIQQTGGRITTASTP